MPNQNPNICFYFQVHQPYRLRDLRITEVGSEPHYFDYQKNKEIFRKVAEKCYLPANKLMLELLGQYDDFKVSYSLSGVFIEQCEEFGPDVLESFKALAATGKVEFLAETYYHSLSAVHSLDEFCEQVLLQTEKIKEHFDAVPQVFRNTELIFNNELAHVARMMGFSGILAEGADHILQGRNPNDPYVPPEFHLPDEHYWDRISECYPGRHPAEKIHILLKNYKLSDDVAFRFSDKHWIGFPLSAAKFTDWLTENAGHSVNLFMDYETFGEHQWADTGIFDFLRQLPAIWQERGIKALTPSEVIADWKEQITETVETPESKSIITALANRWNRPKTQTKLRWEEQVFDAHNHVSWADTERDLSAWQGNHIQDESLRLLYELEEAVKASDNPELIHTWRKLQTSDHFYYMCTKYWHDGDVHKYFSPYDSPYEAYRRFSHAVHDLRHRLQ